MLSPPFGGSDLRDPSSIARSIVASTSSSVAAELRMTQMEEEMNNAVRVSQDEQQHQTKALEAWCREEFTKIKETQSETAASIRTINEGMEASNKEHRDARAAMNVKLIENEGSNKVMMDQLKELLRRVPPANKPKRDATAAALGSREEGEEEETNMG